MNDFLINLLSIAAGYSSAITFAHDFQIDIGWFQKDLVRKDPYFQVIILLSISYYISKKLKNAIIIVFLVLFMKYYFKKYESKEDRRGSFYLQKRYLNSKEVLVPIYFDVDDVKFSKVPEPPISDSTNENVKVEKTNEGGIESPSEIEDKILEYNYNMFPYKSY